MKYTIVTIIIVLSYDNRDKATINFCQYCTCITCNLIIMVVNCLYIFFVIVVLMTIILYTMIIVNSHLLHHFIPKSYISRNCIFDIWLVDYVVVMVVVVMMITNPLHTHIDCPDRPFTKEVIRPQVPLRPPCYDFSLVADPRFDSANKTQPRQEPTSMKRRAVCARSRDVFTAR